MDDLLERANNAAIASQSLNKKPKSKSKGLECGCHGRILGHFCIKYRVALLDNRIRTTHAMSLGEYIRNYSTIKRLNWPIVRTNSLP